MAGRIRDEDIAAVRERSPIDEVVGEYLQLRNAGGGSLKGLCPFHDEKTPRSTSPPPEVCSTVSSCAEGGDAIKFVQKIDGLSFVEAVERLAGRAGIELRYEQGGYVPGQEQSQRRRLIDAHRAAAEYYSERLRGPDAEHARKFLSERGFELKDTERFGVGYSPKAWEDLTRHLRGRGFTDGELIAAGLAREGSAAPRDRFRGRLMWPIRDLSGDVIAFGARKLDPDDDGSQVPEYAGDLAVPEEHRAVRGGPGQAGDRPAQAGGHRRGLHRRDGLPSGRGADRGGHLRHLVRRGPHQGAAQADHGHRWGRPAR